MKSDQIYSIVTYLVSIMTCTCLSYEQVLPQADILPQIVASKVVNAEKNRYKNILPCKYLL